MHTPHLPPRRATPAVEHLANPSGCAHVRTPRARIYRVTAVDAAGARHQLSIRAINHHELHQAVTRIIGEPQFLSCCYDPEATAATRPTPAAPVGQPGPVPANTAPRVPRVHLVSAPRPSAFGSATDIDRRCDAIDSELEQAEQRHTERGRRIAGRWLFAAIVVCTLLWTAAAVGIGAIAARPDRWPELPRSATHGGTH